MKKITYEMIADNLCFNNIDFNTRFVLIINEYMFLF